MRSCIGVRSCASSTITWPKSRGGSRDQRVRLVDERHVGVAPARIPRGERPSNCRSRSSRMPSAASSRRGRDVRSDRTSRSGETAGQTRSSHLPEESLRPQRALDLPEVTPCEPPEARTVVLVEAAQDVHAEPLARMRRQPELVAHRRRAARRLPARARRRTRPPSARRAPPAAASTRALARAGEDVGEACVALQPGDRGRVDRRDGETVDELADRALLDALLAERRAARARRTP